jgi:acetyl-CoA carboxylase biotin carboxyl carrier protein
MMDLKQLKALVKLMVDHDLTELDVEHEGEKVKLKRGSAGVQIMPAAMPLAHTIAPLSTASAAAAPAGGPVAGADDEAHGQEGFVAITSPMVGTFYSSPTPDAKSFIAVGDRIHDDTVVCIIEAMKVFNEIKAEMSGTVKKVLAENGAAVEFGQPLYLVEPA